MQLTIPHNGQDIVIAYEFPDIPRYRPGSADNARPLGVEYFFGEDDNRPSSRHRITVKRRDTILASCILLAVGGASGVHSRSAFLRDGTCMVAIGPFVCALEIPSLRLLWHTRVDAATCFGIYDAPSYAGLVSHGELEIARVNYAGELVWAAGGADIFSEGFELYMHYAEAVDFCGARYRFDLETGRTSMVAT